MVGKSNNFPAAPPIYACINVYDDAGWLERCLWSLDGKVEAIIVVDGAYAGFPHEIPYSTDGTIELAKEVADIVITRKSAWPNEIVKRNAYIPHVPNNKWWLRIDADEELQGEFTEPLDGNCYMVMLERTDGSNNPYPVHALFKKHPSSRYHGTHHAVHLNDEILVKSVKPVYPGVKLLHHCQSRDVKRAERKGTYYRESLAPSEREFRSANGL